MSCGVGHRRGLDPVLLWLWHRLVATDPIGPLVWEPSHVAGAALEKTKRPKKKKKNSLQFCSWSTSFLPQQSVILKKQNILEGKQNPDFTCS